MNKNISIASKTSAQATPPQPGRGQNERGAGCADRYFGRPMKYHRLILILKDETVYTPASIVRYNIALETFNGSRRDLKNARQALSIFSRNHQFPSEGDGQVYLVGQRVQRGWFGARWKSALQNYYKKR